MKNTFRHLLALLIAVICGLLGWWAAHDVEKSVVKPAGSLSPVARSEEVGRPQIRRAVRPSRRDEFRDGTTVEMFASSDADEVILRFPSGETYSSFLYVLATSESIRLVDQLDRLRAMRLSYDDWSDVADLLMDENLVAFDALPSVPTPAPVSGSAQTGLSGFGDGLLGWLGVSSDNSRWGAGVKIAVLDTGVVRHPALPGVSRSIAITPFPADPRKINGHGTAVASLIASNDPFAPGVAPAAELISIRVGDDAGKADAFALAAGILAAVDSGAQIVNCSMGTTENNPLIEEAVLYAHEEGVLIVAASGNSEQADACYPAAYPSVISVGAVDARGEHLEFSNYGTYLSLTAPGYSLNAAWPGNGFSRISGTSASAPIVTGSIAAIMSDGNGVRMTANEAADILMRTADDAGLPGPDSEYGVGILNLGRAMNRNVSGIVDAAIASQRLVKTRNGKEIQVTVQNRGTVVLVNTLLEIQTASGERRFNVTSLAPGGIETFSLPLNLVGASNGKPLKVKSSLVLGTAGQDATPRNNKRVDSFLVGE